jgi:hypothetical protein
MDFIKSGMMPVSNNDYIPHSPSDYRDTQSGTTFHVDGDARRITATDKRGG